MLSDAKRLCVHPRCDPGVLGRPRDRYAQITRLNKKRGEPACTDSPCGSFVYPIGISWLCIRRRSGYFPACYRQVPFRLQMPEQQSPPLEQGSPLAPPQLTHWLLPSSQPCPGHGSLPPWQLPPEQVSAPLHHWPSSHSGSDEQPPPPPQDHGLSLHRVSPQSGRSPSQQYWPLGLPFVFARQSFEQLLQFSPASQAPLLLQLDTPGSRNSETESQ